MSLVLDTANSSQSTSAGATSLTFSNTVAVGATVLVVLAACGTATPTATYNGVSMTKQATVNVNTSQYHIFTLVSPASGAHNVVISTGGASTEMLGIAVSASGGDTTTPVGAIGNSGVSNAATPATLTFNTTYANSVIVDCFGFDRGTTPTKDSSQTLIGSVQGTANYEQGSSYKATTTAGSYTMSWAFTGGGNWGIIAVELKAAGAAVNSGFLAFM